MKSIHILLYLSFLTVMLLWGCDKALVDPGESDLSIERDITSPLSSQHLAQEGSIEGVVEGEYILLFSGNRVPNGFANNIEALGGNVIYQHHSGFAYIGGISEDAAEQLQARRDVSDMAANVSYSLNLPTEPQTSLEAVVTSTYDPAAAFFYPRQWHHRAIGADVAWDAGYFGDEDVTVAILDTGIDYGHADLAGLVDLSRSISFVPGDDLFVDIFFPGRNYVTDLNYHGTHVAATVASNAFVAAGVTSKTTLTGIKVCSVFGSCSFGAVISGLLHAAETGVDIANMSLGGAFSKAGNGEFVGFINRTMNYVRRSGVTVVVAAGNAAVNLDDNGNIYQTYCDSPNVICVSATGPTASDGINGPWTDVDAPAGYTNYGRSAIDVAAPGGTAQGAVWAACSQTSLQIPICQTGDFALGLGGTSMASPHVAGLAALIASQGTSRPAQVKAKILQSADDLGQRGTDPFYGKGRINVANAMGL